MSDPGPEWLTRRRLLALAGASGAAGLAAAFGGSDPLVDVAGDDETEGSGTETSDVSSAPEHPDVRHESLADVDLAGIQFNLGHADDEVLPEISHHLLFEPFARYSYVTDEWLPAGIADWRIADDAVELTLREGLTWTDGEPVTAADLTTQLRLARHASDPLSEWATAVEEQGRRTARVRLAEPRNDALVEAALLDRFLFADRGTYGPILAEIEAGGDPAAFTEFADESPVTNGPWVLDERDQQMLLARRNPNHPDAGSINFREYAVESVSAEVSRPQALASLHTDSVYSVTVRAEIVDEYFTDAVEQVRTPALFGIGLLPNHDDPVVGDRAVRQAIAHVVDREQCVRESTPLSKRVPTVPSGLAPSVRERWLGDATRGFETYGPDESATDRAAAVLRNAGYSRADGTWYDRDGGQVTLRISHPPGWSDWLLIAEAAARQLSDFGIETGTSAVGNYREVRAEGTFQLLAHTWLPDLASPHPYYSLRHQLYEHEAFPARFRYPPAAETTAMGGRAATVTIPAADGNGEVTIDPAARLADLRRARDAETERDIVRELARVANRDLPHLPIAAKLDQQWLTSDEWDLPEDLEEDPDANVRWAATWLPRRGKLRYAGDDGAGDGGGRSDDGRPTETGSGGEG